MIPSVPKACVKTHVKLMSVQTTREKDYCTLVASKCFEIECLSCVPIYSICLDISMFAFS